jgi:hypothetical protein
MKKMRFEISELVNGFEVKKIVSSGYNRLDGVEEVERFCEVVGDVMSDEIKVMRMKR